MLDREESGPRPLALDLTEEVPPLVQVRRWMGSALTDLTEDELGDCLLVVTELVANAYDHGEAPRRLRVYRSAHPSTVRVEVDDAAPGEVVVGRSRLSTDRGRGMLLVQNCGSRWGVERHEDGKTVWAEIDCKSPGDLG
ncbi:ATP-binding protein [Actinosynnema sp. NPDC053489]|uniref:ATP-binding protein n=1 Tax=Actinosynnema sp. NPDC053489 TaxID=3363916 RepID=UPI0037CB0C25